MSKKKKAENKVNKRQSIVSTCFMAFQQIIQTHVETTHKSTKYLLPMYSTVLYG